MALQDTDKFLVNRNNTSYQVEAQNLMSIQDSDLMLVNRNNTSYKIAGSAVKDALGGALPKFNINDCFKQFDYQGNASNRTFDVGFDCRSSAGGCMILITSNASNVICEFDTIRGTNSLLYWNMNGTPFTSSNTVTSFNSNGFSIGNSTEVNTNNRFYKAFVWKVQKGFFDMGSFTGDGSGSRSIPHNLGARPPLMSIKYTGTPGTVGYTYVEPCGINAAQDFGINRGLQSRASIMWKFPDANNFYPHYYYTNTSGRAYQWYAFGGTTGSDEYPVKVGTYKAASATSPAAPNQFLTGGTKAQALLCGTIEEPAGGNVGISKPPVLTNRSGMTNVSNQNFMVAWAYQSSETTSGLFNLTNTTVELPSQNLSVAQNPSDYWYYCIGE